MRFFLFIINLFYVVVAAFIAYVRMMKEKHT